MLTRALVAAMALSLSATAAQAQEKPRPNVLFIVADDLNNDLGCYGDKQVKSPHIDRLAATGVRFDHAYCQYPVCNPSRTSFLSGLRPERTGIVDNVTATRTNLKDAVFLPQLFRLMGYRTIKVGKIFHTGKEFEDAVSWDIDIRETKEAKNPPAEQLLRKQGPGVVLKAKDEDTYDGKLARQAIDHLAQAGKDGKPLFLAVGFRRPHTPYIAPERYFDLYPPKSLTFPAEPAEHLKHIPPLALTYKHGAKALAPKARQQTMAAYYASVSFMDAQVGALLDALDRLKMWDNTIVVFISDHGYHLGEHGGLWHKMTLFEQCCRVPMIVAAPGKKANLPCKGLVELIDLFPTLTDLCSLKAPKDLPGRSVAALLDNPARPGKEAAYTVVSRGGDSATAKLDPTKLGRSVRTARHRYTEWHDGSRELYDYDSDPHEYHNLAESPERAALVAELRKLLTR